MLQKRKTSQTRYPVTAGGYRFKADCCVVQRYSVATRWGAEMTGVSLRIIGSSAGEAEESGCAAAQEDRTRFCGFLFDFVMIATAQDGWGKHK